VATAIQEAQWVLRAQCDDREALESLLRDVQPRLHRYLRSLVGENDAEDVLQDVLILICRKLAFLHTPALFRPWIYRVASREAFRHLKKLKRRPDRVQDELVPLEELAISTVAPSTEMLESLLDADAVTPASRAVLALHFQLELSLPEVAAVLEIPLGTVKSRLASGLAALRKQSTTKGKSNVRRS
jgi:RNA polymerase sigma-70 factor, ECF subfamily